MPLTIEESNVLKNRLIPANPYSENTLFPNAYIIKCINEFTEKPKREIQVGDIYKIENNAGIKEVKIIKEDSFITTEGNPYSLEGADIGPFTRPCLDLSKRYKLVEIEDCKSATV